MQAAQEFGIGRGFALGKRVKRANESRLPDKAFERCKRERHTIDVRCRLGRTQSRRRPIEMQRRKRVSVEAAKQRQGVDAGAGAAER